MDEFAAALNAQMDAEEGDAEEGSQSAPAAFDPLLTLDPSGAEVLAFASAEQRVNWERLGRAGAYRSERIMKRVAGKTARALALESAVRGAPERTMQMRLKANEIKFQMKEDVAKNPSAPHLWSQSTRELAFGGDAAINKLLPIDMDSIAGEFAKIKEAEKEAEEEAAHALGAAARKKAKAKAEEIRSASEALEGFSLSLDLGAVGGGDDDEAEPAAAAEEEEEGSEGEVTQPVALMEPLKNVTNPSFTKFVAQAEGPDAVAEQVRRRRKKKQQARKGKLFPLDGEARDAETHQPFEINETSWIHYKDAPDEYKNMQVLRGIGKFKKRLTQAKEAGTVGAGKGGKGEGAADIWSVGVKDVKPASPQLPSTASAVVFEEKEEEVDWEAAANSLLVDATNEQNEKERARAKAKGGGGGKRVIVATPYVPPAQHKAKAAAPRRLSHDPTKNVKGAATSVLMAANVFEHVEHTVDHANDHHLHPRWDHPEDRVDEHKPIHEVESLPDDSIISDFDLYTTAHQNLASTPIIDVGAADTLGDLVGYQNSEMRKAMAEISVVKDKKHRELVAMIQREELEEIKRKRLEQKTTHPARLARVRHKHAKERKERRDRILGQRQENELIIANKLVALGLIR
ncbi:hypothetical protein TeGR_g9539 [Tetraparma gracilis]|uniref:Uncharacterized protein n=1 Tax=Tetraparma gracilis TaxID=2962635 RepID=A0ABQ6NAU2_9STRA|nr:hypothetical protein TeGR_g9539 [Tetraparma gracilis]